MTPFLYYLLEVIICSALFAGCYWCVLRNRRFYQWNRFYILAAVVMSISIPLLDIPLSDTQLMMSATTDYVAQIMVSPVEVSDTQAQVAAFSFSWPWLVYAVCTIVMLLLFVKETVSLARILHLKRHSSLIRTPDADLYCTDDDTAPFTFFRTIFWKRSVPVDSSEGRCMLRHELAHVRHGHSWDKALMQLVCCLFWMNPFFMLLRRELELVHEFAADNESVGEGNADELSSLILCTLYPNHYHDFTSRFFQSSIKRRIMMMTKDKENSIGLLRKLSVVPVILIALYLFACKADHNDTSGGIFARVEQMPTFNGKPATEGFQEYFNQHSRYSATNSSSVPGITGKIAVTVVIDRNGKVGDIMFDENSQKMMETLGLDIENAQTIESEITQVLKLIPAWTPGRQENKDVAVQITFPVNFRVPKADVKSVVKDKDNVYVVVEKMPVFKGDATDEELRKYLSKSVVYPKDAQEKGIKGTVFITLVINEDGSVSDATIARSASPLLDDEALRVINAMPKWTPGEQKGKPVKVRFTIPIKFELRN